MDQFSFFIIVFCAFLVHGHVNNFTCQISDRDWSSQSITLTIKTFFLYNLTLTSSKKHFQLEVNYSVYDVKGFKFQKSTVEVLTSDVCEALPSITHDSAESSGLIIVEANAFENCADLEYVELNRNSLANLPSGLYDCNKDLREVQKYTNKLTKLNENLFRHNIDLAQLCSVEIVYDLFRQFCLKIILY